MPLVKFQVTKHGFKNSPQNREVQDALKTCMGEYPKYKDSTLHSLFESKASRLVVSPPFTPAVQQI